MKRAYKPFGYYVENYLPLLLIGGSLIFISALIGSSWGKNQETLRGKSPCWVVPHNFQDMAEPVVKVNKPSEGFVVCGKTTEIKDQPWSQLVCVEMQSRMCP